MHVLMLAEGYSDALRQFEQEFHGRQYANKTAKLRVREVKLYTLSINAPGKYELLSDLKSFEEPIEWQQEGSPKSKPPFRDPFSKASKWIIRALRLGGVKGIPEWDAIPNSKIKGSRADGKINYNAHFKVLGVIEDPTDEHGKELV